MIGLLDYLKLGAGAAVGGALVFGFMSLVTIPAAERVAHQAGFDRCQAAVDKEHAVELERQGAANQAALEEAYARERELLDQTDDLNEQLLDLANAITSDDSSARLCLGADRVRDLNAIR